jgi:hypothetical protein
LLHNGLHGVISQKMILLIHSDFLQPVRITWRAGGRAGEGARQEKDQFH